MGSGKPRRVLWSHPMTAPDNLPLPAGFELLCRERELSFRFARRFPRLGALSEYVARLFLAFDLLRRRRRFDVVVTGRYGELFALFQSLWPFGRRPLVLLDVEWYSVHTSPWKAALHRWMHRRMGEGAARIQVFCRVEAANYARNFGIAETRFVWIPYCTSIPAAGADLAGGTIVAFTGGLHHRDYRTLFAAIEGLPIELRVAAPKEALGELNVPANVHLLGVIPASDYWREMERCHFVILSLEPGLARCPGVITYVAAMARGKCVVVNEPAGAPDYIEDEKTGFIVIAREPAALRARLATLLGDRQMLGAVGQSARMEAMRSFSPDAYYRAIRLVIESVASHGESVVSRSSESCL